MNEVKVHHLPQVVAVGHIDAGKGSVRKIQKCFPTSDEAWEHAIYLAELARNIGRPDVTAGAMPTAQGWYAAYINVPVEAQR